MRGLARFRRAHAPPIDLAAGTGRRGSWTAPRGARRSRRSSERRCRRDRRSFCIGCPERPVFAALKLVAAGNRPRHIAADIGCHSFATFEPFSPGTSILGYGMSLA